MAVLKTSIIPSSCGAQPICLKRQSARSYVSHIEHARLRMHAGDFDQALDRLEQAYAEHESSLVYTIVNPLFRPVWNDTRYQELLRKMNYK